MWGKTFFLPLIVFLLISPNLMADEYDDLHDFKWREGKGLKPYFAEDPAFWQRMMEMANQGNASAQYRIGDAYLLGQFEQLCSSAPKRDLDVGFDWILKSAKQNYPHAQMRLYILYSGLGFKKNPLEAFNWLQKAAESGSIVAPMHLASAYSEGIVCRKDLVEAYKWDYIYRKLNRASIEEFKSWNNSNDPVANAISGQSLNEQILRQLTPDQIADAKNRAENWLKQDHPPKKSWWWPF